MTRLLLLLLALACTPAIAFAGGDDDDSAASDDDDDSADEATAGDVPEENRVLGGGCDGQTPSGPYAVLPLVGLAFGVTRIRRRLRG